MTYTHPYLFTPYILGVDTEPRGTQHQQLPPACGWCLHPSNTLPPPLRHPPPGEFIELEQSGGVEPGAGGDFATKRRHQGSTRGVMVASSGAPLALSLCLASGGPGSFNWQLFII